MRRPKAGDKIRVQQFICGHFSGFREVELEELNFCLGVFGEDGPKTIENFTPLCEMVDPAPDAERLYWSNFGEYFSDYVQNYELIAVD